MEGFSSLECKLGWPFGADPLCSDLVFLPHARGKSILCEHEPNSPTNSSSSSSTTSNATNVNISVLGQHQQQLLELPSLSLTSFLLSSSANFCDLTSTFSSTTTSNGCISDDNPGGDGGGVVPNNNDTNNNSSTDLLLCSTSLTSLSAPSILQPKSTSTSSEHNPPMTLTSNNAGSSYVNLDPLVEEDRMSILRSCFASPVETSHNRRNSSGNGSGGGLVQGHLGDMSCRANVKDSTISSQQIPPSVPSSTPLVVSANKELPKFQTLPHNLQQHADPLNDPFPNGQNSSTVNGGDSSSSIQYNFSPEDEDEGQGQDSGLFFTMQELTDFSASEDLTTGTTTSSSFNENPDDPLQDDEDGFLDEFKDLGDDENMEEGVESLEPDRLDLDFEDDTANRLGSSGDEPLQILHTDDLSSIMDEDAIKLEPEEIMDEEDESGMKAELKCKFCGFVCCSKSSLGIHERRHTGERPYSCKYCGRLFNSAQCCKHHERLHTGDKPFECQYCGKKYAVSTRLKRHERVHTREEPYKCLEPGCGKTFRWFDAFRDHRNTHNGVPLYLCSVCGKSFTSYLKFYYHERGHLLRRERERDKLRAGQGGSVAKKSPAEKVRKPAASKRVKKTIKAEPIA